MFKLYLMAQFLPVAIKRNQIMATVTDRFLILVSADSCTDLCRTALKRAREKKRILRSQLAEQAKKKGKIKICIFHNKTDIEETRITRRID